MKIIFNVPQPKNSSHIIWRHATTSVMAFVGTFAFLIFGPMLTEAKTKNHDSLINSRELIGWMSGNTEITYLTCFLIAIIANIFVYRKNSKCKYVQRISVSNNQVHFLLVDLMFKTSLDYAIAINELEVKIKSEEEGERMKTKKISFYKINEGKPFAEILTNHFIWEKHVAEMKFALKSLHQLGVKVNRKSRAKKSPISNVFR